jgi:hypothetical protein
MKPLWRSLGVVPFLIVFINLGNIEAWAADWKYLVETQEEVVSYDAESITRPSDNLVRVGVKTVFSKKGIHTHVKEFGERFENLSYITDLLEFNCVEKKTRILRTTLYSNDGTILVSDTSSELEWRFILPDSLGEILYKEVCK